MKLKVAIFGILYVCNTYLSREKFLKNIKIGSVNWIKDDMKLIKIKNLVVRKSQYSRNVEIYIYYFA